ncbi:hypothetical protein [Halalkalibacterium halodurans]|uniref:hypothetical protein n=1 Tax=Halalkalibacterium halodurans TaxID=86665 RepID=UPI002AA9C6CD|nr:hypothetical protein [Halalkalibacterium halodurans]MDY7222072.1 hypothetical protein [Halalkalibacterium halodurans]MDY7243909.1 hypothetical protein [Halalkalibacterium halodurans]
MSQKRDLDYKGLDAPKKLELCLKNVLSTEVRLRQTYIERLETFNKESLQQNPEPFRFFKKENCSVLVFILPYEFNFSTSCRVFFLSTPGKRREKIYTLTQHDLRDLDTYVGDSTFFYNKMLPIHNYHKSQTILSLVDHYDTLSFEGSYFSRSFSVDRRIRLHMNDIISIIKEEIESFQENSNTPLSYFAKDAYKFPFSLLDLKPLIELVNSEDFTYQLDQAMAAYHQNLFLPCAATLGVVLETLCIKILEDHDIKLKTGDTQLSKLKEKLSSEKIITRRDNARLDVAYKMRNLASHSNPGVTLKEDCHFMLNVINTIAFQYLKRD